ncbi:hypothetical protein SAMN05421788_11579 [Filimonas lacunae]|uniref:Uncharacterized protein n=1 Tax=Filimonas lacunae TaxID=477680 RepID=A0A173MC71_9BACT|nr:hypothetical protein FLA_1086 [Filimonas lacunae]SIT34258.1 hypothetical protein SAMN05421788_11579 [Filimonas lacunae]
MLCLAVNDNAALRLPLYMQSYGRKKGWYPPIGVPMFQKKFP